MNILPHKSWHVRTKKNIARFRRDEERAKQEEEELQKRISQAENEARIRQLRRQSNVKAIETATQTDSERFNLFQDFRDKTAADSEKNAEKKIEQERWEVRQGIFSYLDGRYKYDANNKQSNNDIEWYLKSHQERMNLSPVVDDAKAERVKRENDPLQDMKRYLDEMRKKDDPSSVIDNQTKHYGRKKIKVEPSGSYHASTLKKKKNKRGHRRSFIEGEKDEEDPAAKIALIQRLRAERLERERRERERTRVLLRGPGTEAGASSMGSVKQKYNSQFNPHLARQNMDDV